MEATLTRHRDTGDLDTLAHIIDTRYIASKSHHPADPAHPLPRQGQIHSS
jgi:hypothetical protein